MDDLEFSECMKHIDPLEVMMRRKKPMQLAQAGKTEDAIACAMAEGIRMGWDAHKKKTKED